MNTGLVSSFQDSFLSLSGSSWEGNREYVLYPHGSYSLDGGTILKRKDSEESYIIKRNRGWEGHSLSKIPSPGRAGPNFQLIEKKELKVKDTTTGILTSRSLTSDVVHDVIFVHTSATD